MTEHHEEVVLTSEREAGHGYRVAFAELNSPRSLNALSERMIAILQPQLRQWAEREDIACVVLCGAGDKAFCAGGDIVGLYKAVKDDRASDAERYFAGEYRLDHEIHVYPKPVLCWGQGVVMGGGLGLMAGASHRVVTATTRIAMPEVSIGLFPDVGAAWFLGRMPSHMGLFLGMTATQMGAGDALWLGLADHYLPDMDRQSVFDALCAVEWHAGCRQNNALLSQVLRGFEQPTLTKTARMSSTLLDRQDVIAELGEAIDASEYLARLEAVAQEDNGFTAAAAALEKGSPTSASVIHRQLRRANTQSLADVFRQDFCMGIQCIRQPDLAEGIRALLIDKDKNPQWQPATLSDVSRERVDAFFRLPDDYTDHPLADL